QRSPARRRAGGQGGAWRRRRRRAGSQSVCRFLSWATPLSRPERKAKALARALPPPYVLKRSNGVPAAGFRGAAERQRLQARQPAEPDPAHTGGGIRRFDTAPIPLKPNQGGVDAQKARFHSRNSLRPCRASGRRTGEADRLYL